MAGEYDFIVVGGGNAGAVVASRLAKSSRNPTVLLLEGGGLNQEEALRNTDLRYGSFMNPELDYGYQSTPQPQLNGRQIPCFRGRGLGGSSAINFAAWLIGDKEDFNRWAEIVDDGSWRWDGSGGVKQRFRKIENLRFNPNEQQAMVITKEAIQDHSRDGMVHLTYNRIWTELDWLTFKAGAEFGQPLNGDINSGDPTGFGLGPSTYHHGLRVTSATAYLSSPPGNLTILTQSVVSKILFDDSKTARGVETLAGNTYHVKKEVILCAGSLDSPKILLLSGIGPQKEASRHSISTVQDLSGVGKNLIDHCLVTTTLLLKPKEDIDVSESLPDYSDPLEYVGAQCPMAWISSPAVKSSTEFNDLSEPTKLFLQKVPSFELIALSFPFGPAVAELMSPGDQVLTIIGAVMNSQSTAGSVTLASSNASDPPLIDVGYVTHPYDRRVAIEALRAAVAYSKMPAFASITQKTIEGPNGDSDEDLWEHVKKSTTSVFHFSGTCRMGRNGDDTAVVDSNFKVNGVKGLRVADLSVAPLMINNHTQSTAYLIGETAAEKIMAEYGL